MIHRNQKDSDPRYNKHGAFQSNAIQSNAIKSKETLTHLPPHYESCQCSAFLNNPFFKSVIAALCGNGGAMAIMMWFCVAMM